MSDKNKNETQVATTNLIRRVVPEPTGNHGTVRRIDLTEAGQRAITTKATNMGTGYYVPRSERIVSK